MKINMQNMRTYAAFGVLSIALSGCGRKSDDGGAAAPVPKPKIDSPKIQDGKATIGYSSTVEGAEYQCRIDIDDKQGEYEDCDSSGLQIPNLKPGSHYKIYVKTVLPNGQQSESASRTFDVDPATNAQPGAGAQPTPVAALPDMSQVTTEILNADSLGQSQNGVVLVTASDITLRFGIDSTEITAADLTYECKLDTDTAFKLCAGDSYTLSNLQAGKVYRLTVRAVHRVSRVPAKEATIAIRAGLPEVSLTGADLTTQQAGTAYLTVNFPGAQTYCWDIDQASAAGAAPKCSSNGQLPLPIGAQQPGSHILNVTAFNSSSVQIAQSHVTFCSQSCNNNLGSGGSISGSTSGSFSGGISVSPGTNIQPTIAPFDAGMYIGGGYGFVVPQDMHVTEYSTTSSQNNEMAMFQVTNDSDPFYGDIYNCGRMRRSQIELFPMPDRTLWYCHSTPDRNDFKSRNQYRLAFNHIEVAANKYQKVLGWDPIKQQVKNPTPSMVVPDDYKILSVSVFDQGVEYMNKYSRFYNLCNASAGTDLKMEQVPMINGFYYGTLPQKVDFWTCTTLLTVNGSAKLFKVGSFFAVKGQPANYNCGQCGYPEAMEVVYMEPVTQQNAASYYFAQRAQDAILNSLVPTRPH